MNNTCAVTTLKIHSSGAIGTRYAPVFVDSVWILTNDNGNALSGTRGKIFEFSSQEKASNWLCTNLSRLKNKTKPTGDDYLKQLGDIYAESLQEYVLDEIKNIYDFEHGLWQVIECAGATEYITIDASIDYDGGDANGMITN